MFKGKIAFLVLMCTLLAPGLVAAMDDPVELVRMTSSHVLKQIDSRRRELERDSSHIYELVQKDIIPHFDFYVMSRGALGRHWRKASDDQKQRVASEFQEMLVRTYALSLLNYSGSDVQYLPFRAKPDATKVTVSTKVKANDGPPIPINYRLYLKDGHWLIYDVVIDGVSLVSNYRSSFSAEVRKGGIDGLIATLEARNKKLRGKG